MSGYTFKREHLHGSPHPDMPGLVYMQLHVEGRGAAFSGYVPPGVSALIESAPDLLEALSELLAAELTQIPPYESGKEAQDAWAARRAAARNNARAVITNAIPADESSASL